MKAGRQSRLSEEGRGHEHGTYRTVFTSASGRRGDVRVMEKPTIHSRKQPHIRDRALRAVRTVNFEPAPGPVPSAAVRIRHQITSIVSRIAPLRLTNSSRTTLDRLTNGSRPLVPCSRPLSTRAPPALDHSLPLSTTPLRRDSATAAAARSSLTPGPSNSHLYP